VTPQRRTDLALLLIIRRAERDAGMPSRARWEEPDTRTDIAPGRDSDEPESPPSS
jgi:hypothetical protein